MHCFADHLPVFRTASVNYPNFVVFHLGLDGCPIGAAVIVLGMVVHIASLGDQDAEGRPVDQIIRI